MIGLAAVLFSAVTAARAEASPAMGDLNGDGMLSASDAAATLRAAERGAIAANERPDLDLTKNGTIDGTDARAMLFYAAGGIAELDAFGEWVASGLCAETLFDRFSYTGVTDDGAGNYKSETVSIKITRGRAETSNYQLADIYLQDLDCLRTVFSGGRYNGGPVTVKTMFESQDDAIIGINGDYYKQNHYGPVIRNGTVFLDRITTKWDIALLLTSGELVIYDYHTLTREMLDYLDVCQAWVFGPSLLDAEGCAKKKFRSVVQDENPRTVLGYYEPGHYAFLTVDGRSSKSDGMTMRQLSQLCEDLGFTRAYNLDGGQSSVMIAKSGPVNNPYRNGRPISDIIVICDPPAEAADLENEND